RRWAPHLHPQLLKCWLRPSGPGKAEVANAAVRNRVPLRAARRVVAYAHAPPVPVAELLRQRLPPNAGPLPVTAAAGCQTARITRGAAPRCARPPGRLPHFVIAEPATAGVLWNIPTTTNPVWRPTS